MTDYTTINTKVESKTAETKQALIAEQNKLGMKHGKNSLAKIVTSVKNDNTGIVHRIRFRFKRSGVFVHKGVGRGTTAAQAGTTKRVAKEWFNPIIEKFADELADEVADDMVQIFFNNLTIK